jgi:amidase
VAADLARPQAAAAADAVTRTAPADLPPFHGVPVSLKDVVHAVGMPTTHGSGAWRNNIATIDHAVVRKLREAGFIVFGKNKLPEFSGGMITEPLAYGPCRNPWDLDRAVGGSSGGSGAAVAAGMTPLSLGSDDGGSIRIPSNWNGVFGIKPSRGRVSCAPDQQSMEFTTGPIARSVADGAAMLDAISGYVRGDGFTAPPPDRPFLDEVGADPGRLRVVVTTAAADGVEVDADVIAAVEQAGKLLEQLGHHVERRDDWVGRGAFPDNRAVGLHLIYGAKYDAFTRWGIMPPVDQLEPSTQFLIELSKQATAADVMLAQHLAAERARQLIESFQDFDVLVTPVMACRPPEIGRFVDHPEENLAFLDAVQWTGQFNQSGQPAVAVPVTLDRGGTPVGVQIAGQPHGEAMLIRLAAQLEKANPWGDRRPTAIGGL